MHLTHGGPDASGVPLHDFSTNSNALGPCPLALAAVREADPSRYPDPRYTALRARLAAHHCVAAERIVLAASASEFIFRITAAMAQRGAGCVVLPAHSYGDYEMAARAWRWVVQRESSPFMPAVETSDADQSPRLLWRCDPSSPMGQGDIMLGAWVDGLRRDDVGVIDLAYEPLRLSGGLSLSAAQRDRVWQLWTPNKALGLTGVRAAYAVAPATSTALQQTVEALAPSWPVGAHGVAMLGAWTTPQVRQWVSHSLGTLVDWKRQQLALCSAMGWQVEPSNANFFCARPPIPPATSFLPMRDVAALCAALRTQGIKLRDATSFGLPGVVRLGVLPPASQAALKSAWDALAR